MAGEISEGEATGEIATIFAELRTLWGVPYVSAIHRYLAAKPGFLEWSWDAVAPAFRNGSGQEAAWRCAAGLAVPPLDPIPAAALRVWGVDGAALADVRNAAEGFVRVAPVNMVFAGLVKQLLEGAEPTGIAAKRASWTAPVPLPAPPEMVDLARLDPAARDVTMLLASEMGGKPFVPGLYRMLAHWPGLMAHLATVLRPCLTSAPVMSVFDELRRRIDAAVPEVLASLPAVSSKRPRPSDADRADFFNVGQTYRRTSPELVVVGQLLMDALPKQMD
ncbi:hypothetical protein [Hyphomicrobium sp. CS1BSMeth3]|uniref:hypothetical protein n=1 Tax=Hyphomicrobium sp. CS1BSMeth3 TaxID=1892844 RepID=UPI000931C819|nr:hypothetical protein [Hyphomicrobium sp. CS1BSMeth3]